MLRSKDLAGSEVLRTEWIDLISELDMLVNAGVERIVKKQLTVRISFDLNRKGRHSLCTLHTTRKRQSVSKKSLHLPRATLCDSDVLTFIYFCFRFRFSFFFLKKKMVVMIPFIIHERHAVQNRRAMLLTKCGLLEKPGDILRRRVLLNRWHLSDTAKMDHGKQARATTH